MDKEIKTWLQDILAMIDEVENYFVDRPKRYADYVGDLRTKRAIERNISVIGEATNRILKHDSPVEITHARKIVDLRNRLVHGYDAISDEFIWGIVINHLPNLKIEVEKFLTEHNTKI